MNSNDFGSIDKIAASLTGPQKDALKLFVPSKARRVFPDINPRTAQALWSLGILMRETMGRTSYFSLTAAGEELQARLGITSQTD